MASKRSPKRDSRPTDSSSDGRPASAPKMIRRVVHDDQILEPGDPCPVTGETLARWQKHGWVD